MSYRINECFATIQGEGFHAGTPAVFLRFTTCNLWSGKEEQRFSPATVCQFCDTSFRGTDGEAGGGGVYQDQYEVTKKVVDIWKAGFYGHYSGIDKKCLLVVTGGEPFFRGNLDSKLVSILRSKGFYVAVETNGTCLFDKKLHNHDQEHYLWKPDWVTVSPKANTDWLTITQCMPIDELKVVYPQDDLDMELVMNYAADNLDIHRFIQPMDVGNEDGNRETLAKSLEFIKKHPLWRLSLQTHKIIGVA